MLYLYKLGSFYIRYHLPSGHLLDTTLATYEEYTGETLSSKAAASMHLIEFYLKQNFVGFEQSSKSPVEFSIQASLLFDLSRVSSIEFRALC